MKLTQTIALLLFLSSVHACSGEAGAARGAGKVVDSSSGTVVLGINSARAYRPASLSAAGSIAGSITLDSAPADSVVPVTRKPELCGANAKVTQTRMSGAALANALVWVEGPSTGKRLPELRRETLTIERCQFEPRVLAVTSGTTINVLSRDHAIHTSRFYREGAGEPVDEVRTVDAGQVVPSEKIASGPGLVEARRTEDTWARAYIAVFDHPYFAVTDDRGAYRIDSLPPGTYSVKVWHERLAKPVEQRVVVAPGGASRADAALTLRD